MRDLGRINEYLRYREALGKLNKIYKDAEKDLRMKLASWEHAHEARVRKYQAQLQNGEITQADYNAWMRGQIFQRQAWQNKVRQIEELMTDADAEALGVINGGKIEVFADSANFHGYMLEQGAGLDYGFGVYNQQTVRRLLREDPKLLPLPDPRNAKKSKNYAWYNRIISEAVTQGIMQGEDLDGIVMRIQLETNERSIEAMRRNARTAYNSAQNAGVMEGMRQAIRIGIEEKKRWVSMLLPTTREAHAELNGVELPVDEPFHNQIGDIMQPGDPEADPANVYNCHCHIEAVHVKYPDENRGKQDRMSFERWKAMKGGGGNGRR